jgi:hypothetical protein
MMTASINREWVDYQDSCERRKQDELHRKRSRRSLILAAGLIAFDALAPWGRDRSPIGGLVRLSHATELALPR